MLRQSWRKDNRIGVSNSKAATAAAGFSVFFGGLLIEYRWIRLTLNMASDAAIMDAPRKSPRAGSLFQLNGRLIVAIDLIRQLGDEHIPDAHRALSARPDWGILLLSHTLY